MQTRRPERPGPFSPAGECGITSPPWNLAGKALRGGVVDRVLRPEVIGGGGLIHEA